MGLSDPDRLRDSLHGSVYQSREILESPQGSGASCAGIGPGFCGLSGVHGARLGGAGRNGVTGYGGTAYIGASSGVRSVRGVVTVGVGLGVCLSFGGV